MKNIVWRLLFTVFCLCNSLLLFGQKKIITADTISQNGKTYFVIPKNSDTLSYNNITYVVIPEMNDKMRENGKIYVVVAVCLTILIGLFIYVLIVDRKVKRLEKDS